MSLSPSMKRLGQVPDLASIASAYSVVLDCTQDDDDGLATQRYVLNHLLLAIDRYIDSAPVADLFDVNECVFDVVYLREELPEERDLLTAAPEVNESHPLFDDAWTKFLGNALADPNDRRLAALVRGLACYNPDDDAVDSLVELPNQVLVAALRQSPTLAKCMQPVLLETLVQDTLLPSESLRDLVEAVLQDVSLDDIHGKTAPAELRYVASLFNALQMFGCGLVLIPSDDHEVARTMASRLTMLHSLRAE